MTDKNIHKLIQKCLEGDLSPEEDARLKEMLSSSDEAASLYRQMELLDEELKANVSKVYDIDIDITEKVMQRIEQKQKEQFSLAPLFDIFNRFFASFRLQYAVAVLAGVLIGSFATFFLSAPSDIPRVEMLSGTVSASRSDAISLTRDHTSVKIVPYEIGEMLYLNFMVQSREDVEVSVSYEDIDFEFKNADYIAATGNHYTDFGMNTISFGAIGRTNYQMILEKIHQNQAPIHVTVYKDQQTLFSQLIYIE